MAQGRQNKKTVLIFVTLTCVFVCHRLVDSWFLFCVEMSAWVEGFMLLEDKRFERAASTVIKVEFRPSTSHPGWCRTRDTTFGCRYLVPEENVALTIPALYEQQRKEVNVG